MRLPWRSPEAPRPAPRLTWRLAAALTFAAAGALLVTSYQDADGTQLRSSRYDDFADVVDRQRALVDARNEEIARLQAEITRLSSAVDDAEVEQTSRRLAALRRQAGLTPVRGPGVTVILDDAPDQVLDRIDEAAGVTEDDLVVHQQDIQAVANALWSAGAEAMTIRGQRVISTTGIKCVGNTVILHGVPYSPPYDITAIGDPVRLQRALEDSQYLDFYRQVVDRYSLVYEVRVEPDLRLPGYSGSLDFQLARSV